MYDTFLIEFELGIWKNSIVNPNKEINIANSLITTSKTNFIKEEKKKIILAPTSEHLRKLSHLFPKTLTNLDFINSKMMYMSQH